MGSTEKARLVYVAGESLVNARKIGLQLSIEM